MAQPEFELGQKIQIVDTLEVGHIISYEIINPNGLIAEIFLDNRAYRQEKYTVQLTDGRRKTFTNFDLIKYFEIKFDCII